MATVATDHYRAYAPRPFTRAERDSTTILFGGLHWRVERVIQGKQEPVRLSLVSDNRTQVTIPSVGSFGSFARRDVELKPGHYTVIGTRDGYREVRHEITVSPGEEYLTVNVSCSEPI